MTPPLCVVEKFWAVGIVAVVSMAAAVAVVVVVVVAVVVVMSVAAVVAVVVVVMRACVCGGRCAPMAGGYIAVMGLQTYMPRPGKQYWGPRFPGETTLCVLCTVRCSGLWNANHWVSPVT